MSSLISFLSAQLDADEQVARDATVGHWRWVVPGGRYKNALVASGYPYHIVLLAAESPLSAADAKHIAVNDPAHVLRTIAAHRAIVAWVLQQQVPRSTVGDDFWFPLYAIAAIYDSRDGWDPAWKVEA